MKSKEVLRRLNAREGFFAVGMIYHRTCHVISRGQPKLVNDIQCAACEKVSHSDFKEVVNCTTLTFILRIVCKLKAEI